MSSTSGAGSCVGIRVHMYQAITVFKIWMISHAMGRNQKHAYSTRVAKVSVIDTLRLFCAKG